MEKFIRLTARACPLDVTNLNTDQLLPARFLKLPRAAGLGTALLRDLRFDAEGRERPDFPLNRPAWREARIIVGARNFGCGSSREVGGLCALRLRHPLRDRALLRRHLRRQRRAERIVDRGRRGRCGGRAHAPLDETPDAPVTVDLEQQTIACRGETLRFTIDPVRRTRLLNGWDDVAMTESYVSEIAAFKAADRARRPWARPAKPG